MRKRFTLFGLLLFFSLIGNAQDPSFSQFYANRIYLNPAFTGIESGLSVAGVSRMQWLNVDYGFRTFGVSIEIQEPFIRSGFGLNLLSNTEGLAQLTTNSVGLSYAYTIPMEKHNIHFGVEASWVQKSVDWSKIIFSDQLDPVYGSIYPTSYVPVLDRVSYTDFQAGVLWRFSSDLKLGKRKYKNVLSSVGLSIHHLPSLFSSTGGGESLQNLETKTAPRLTFHAGTVIPMVVFHGSKKEIAISPNIKFDTQGDDLFQFRENLQVFTYGVYLLYDGFYVGALYQNKNIVSNYKNTNSWILAAGLKVSSGKDSKFFIGLSYDANITGVGTRAGGVYEIAFRWTGNYVKGIFGGKRKNKSKKYLKCFSFF
jgi:type IX secretion system PorP/SprF family membrane protein